MLVNDDDQREIVADVNDRAWELQLPQYCTSFPILSSHGALSSFPITSLFSRKCSVHAFENACNKVCALHQQQLLSSAQRSCGISQFAAGHTTCQGHIDHKIHNDSICAPGRPQIVRSAIYSIVVHDSASHADCGVPGRRRRSLQCLLVKKWR